jgi:hypothetical protein
MTKKEVKRELIEFYGREAYDLAAVLVQHSDPDGAWSLAMDQGLEDVAEIIEELYFGD